MDILTQITQKGIEIERVAEKAVDSPDSIPQLFDGLNNKKGAVRFGCEKVIRLISEEQPEIIYPYFDKIVTLLESDNNILKWGAIIIISNLAPVDTEKKFEKRFKKYFAPVTGRQMITASNIVKNAWKIALAKPSLVEKITKEILKVEKTEYENKGALSPECNRIVCGHAIDSLSRFYEKIKDKKPVMDFIRRQVNNPRSAVAKKAEKFAKKYK
ncbi:MAG: hypothetical protein PVG39_19185 [Desulfobacteraceae bacterium]|jgi:hypothetical protein